MKTNVTDRELLKLAAKAAGVDLWGKTYMAGNYFYGDNRRWAPLTDDGHALRLAVKLGLHIDIQLSGWVEVTMREGLDNVSEAYCLDDPYAATRRAIVRAAAAIGKESHEEARS